MKDWTLIIVAVAMYTAILGAVWTVMRFGNRASSIDDGKPDRWLIVVTVLFTLFGLIQMILVVKYR